MPNKVCQNCQKEYYALPKDAPTQRFCSVDCRKKYNRPNGQKWCSKGKHFVEIQDFSKCSQKWDGLAAYCRKCISEDRKINAEKIRLQTKTFRDSNPEKMKARSRRYYLKTAKQQCEKSRRYNAENRVRVQQKQRRYYQENKAKFSRARDARRGKLREMISNFTKAQWLQKLIYFGNCCYLCKTSLENVEIHIEHRIPISRGGSNWIANIAPACKKCNLTKNTKTEKEFRKWKAAVN